MSNTPNIPFTTADTCWCQPFDSPKHPHCPKHGAPTTCEECGAYTEGSVRCEDYPDCTPEPVDAEERYIRED